MENHASVTGVKSCVSHTNTSNFRYFRDIRLKILRLPIFNMLFQLVLTKFFKVELFSCLPKVDHVIKSCKEPIGQLCIGGHGYSSRTVTDRH